MGNKGAVSECSGGTLPLSVDSFSVFNVRVFSFRTKFAVVN